MKKTKIAFADIKAGDLLEVVGKFAGVRSAHTGIAFEKEVTEDEESVWQTSEGGNIVMEWDKDDIYRIDVTPVKFEDIRKGDLVKVTNMVADTESIVIGRAEYVTEDLSNNYWLTTDGIMLLTRLERGTIEILERRGE